MANVKEADDEGNSEHNKKKGRFNLGVKTGESECAKYEK